MAIGVTLLHDGATTTDSNSYITASLSPAAGGVLIAVAQLAGISTATATSVSGISGTWTNITGSNRYNTSVDLSVHVCTDYSGSGGVTFTNSNGATHAIVAVFHVSGANTTDPIVAGSLQKVTPGSVNSVSLSLPAAAHADNRVFAAYGCDNNTAGQATPRASWTELTDRGIGTPNGVMETQWRADAHETTASVTWVGGPYTSAGVAFEIAAAAAGGGGSTGTALLRWTFDEGSGTVVADSSPNARHGTQAYFGAWTASSKYGAAAYENPSGGAWPTTSDNTSIVNTSQAFTIAGWVYLADNTQDRTAMAVTGSSTAAVLLGYRQSANRWVFAMRTSDGGTEVAVTSSGAPTLNTWTHLAAVYNGTGGMTLYVDGSSAGTGTLGSDWTYASNKLVVGEAGMTGVLDQWYGRVDDVWAFQETLTAGDIADVMAGNAPTGVSVSGIAVAAFGGVSATAAGKRGVAGAAAAVLGALAAAGAGTHGVIGPAAATLGGLTAAASGTRHVAGTAAAALGGLSATGQAAFPLGELTDDFSDNSIDTSKWPNNYGAVSEVGGRARVACETAAWNGWKSATTYTMTGTRAGGRFYPPPAAGATSTAYMTIVVASSTSGTDAGFNIDVQSGFMAAWSRVGFSDPDAVYVSYDATSHAWLRLRESAGTLRWEASPDGATWSVLRAASTPAWMAHSGLALLVECKRTDGTDNYGEFDDINLFVAAAGSVTADLTGSATAAGTRRVTATAGAEMVGSATAVGDRTVHAAANATLGGLTATASGEGMVRAAGSAALTLTTTAAGDRTVHATAAAPLGGLTAAASGQRRTAGTASGTLGALTAAAAADRAVRGNAVAVLGGLTGTAAAEKTVRAAATTSEGFAGAAIGTRRTSGAATAALGGLTAAASGEGVITAGGAAHLGLTATADGRRRTAGSADAQVVLVTTVAGRKATAGAAAAVLGGIDTTGGGRRTVRGAAASPLGPLGAAGAGTRKAAGQLAAALGGLIAIASGVVEAVGGANAYLGALTGTAAGHRATSGTAATAPSFGATAVGQVTAAALIAAPHSITMTNPAATVAMTGTTAAVTDTTQRASVGRSV